MHVIRKALASLLGLRGPAATPTQDPSSASRTQDDELDAEIDSYLDLVTAEKIRMLAQPHLVQINTGFTGDFSMLLSNNASTGGTCFGDSGGPNYLGTSNVVAGVTSFGINGNCAGTGGVFRLDKRDVLDFVNSYLR